MKLFKILPLFFLFAILSTQAIAQIKVDVNIGTPTVVTTPVWGPIVTTEQYYFLPEIDTYYDIRNAQYLTLNNGTWVRTRNVPARYRTYNFNTGKVIVINDYKGRAPYVKYSNHKVKYFKGGKKWKPMTGNNGNSKMKGRAANTNGGHGKNGKNGHGKN